MKEEVVGGVGKTSSKVEDVPDGSILEFTRNGMEEECGIAVPSVSLFSSSSSRGLLSSGFPSSAVKLLRGTRFVISLIFIKLIDSLSLFVFCVILILAAQKASRGRWRFIYGAI